MKLTRNKTYPLIERGKAALEVVAGAVQETAGRVLGDDRLTIEGAAHRALGEARDAAAKLAETSAGVVDEIVGEAKDKAGQVVGDNGLVIRGKLQRLAGKLRQVINE